MFLSPKPHQSSTPSLSGDPVRPHLVPKTLYCRNLANSDCLHAQCLQTCQLLYEQHRRGNAGCSDHRLLLDAGSQRLRYTAHETQGQRGFTYVSGKVGGQCRKDSYIRYSTAVEITFSKLTTINMITIIAFVITNIAQKGTKHTTQIQLDFIPKQT